MTLVSFFLSKTIVCLFVIFVYLFIYFSENTASINPLRKAQAVQSTHFHSTGKRSFTKGVASREPMASRPNNNKNLDGVLIFVLMPREAPNPGFN